MLFKNYASNKNGYVLTMAGKPIRNGCVLIDGSKISISVGKRLTPAPPPTTR